MTPRSKFYAIKYHRFCLHLKHNKISVEKITTDSQHADIVTKGLTQAAFENIQIFYVDGEHHALEGVGVQTPVSKPCH